MPKGYPKVDKIPMSLTKIAAKYQTMMKNGRILSNRATIEVIDERIQQLADRIDVEDAPDRMAKLHELWLLFNAAEPGSSDYIVARKSLDIEFEKAYHDYMAWEQLMSVFDLRRKMVDSEVKVIKEIKAILTAEDAMQLVGKLLAVCTRVVDDPVKLRVINYEFSRIVGEEAKLDDENPKKSPPSWIDVQAAEDGI